jgi:Tfp pilus assembly protein PilN
VDRLWMGGLGAALAVYIAGVMIYFGILGVQLYRTGAVQAEVQQLSGSYTNTLQLKARMQVLQDRQALKYASLDCWKAVAEELPESLTLQGLDFKNGKTLALSGIAPADQANLITDFTEHLQKKTVNGQLFFASVDSAPWQRNPGGSTITWNIHAELAHGEGE